MNDTVLSSAFHIRHVHVVELPLTSSTRSGRSRARWSVLLGIVLFVAIQFSLFRMIQYDAVPVRDPIFAEKFQLLQQHAEFFQDDTETTRIMALGSSRTLLAFDAQKWNSDSQTAFNFGCAGCGPIANALAFRKLLAHGVHAEIVLIEIHPAMLANQNPPFEHRWLHDYRLNREDVEFLHAIGWNKPMPKHLQPGGWLSTTSAYRFALLNEYSPQFLPCPFAMTNRNCDAFGFIRAQEVPVNEREEHRTRAMWEYAPALQNYELGGPALEAIRATIRQCHRAVIQPVLVVLPESPLFRSWYGTEANMQIPRRIQDLAREENATVINAREWLDEADFSDGHHATASGAARFTQRLKRELPAPRRHAR